MRKVGKDQQKEKVFLGLLSARNMRNANLKTEYIVADASPQAAQHFWQENYQTYYTGIAANIYLQKIFTDTLTKKSFEHVIVEIRMCVLKNLVRHLHTLD